MAEADTLKVALKLLLDIREGLMRVNHADGSPISAVDEIERIRTIEDIDKVLQQAAVARAKGE